MVQLSKEKMLKYQL